MDKKVFEKFFHRGYAGIKPSDLIVRKTIS